MVFFFWQMLEMYYLENIVLTALKLRCPAIPSQKRVLNQIQVRSVIELESFNSYLQLLFNSLLTTKRRHLDWDKVNPGAHDKGSWWILRLFLLLVVRSCAPFAGVASISNRVIARKLERQQKKMKEGGGGGDKRFPFLPISSRFIPDIFFALVPTFSTNSRGNACYAGYMAIRFSFFLSFLQFFFSHNNFPTITKKKPVFNGHSLLIADWPA